NSTAWRMTQEPHRLFGRLVLDAGLATREQVEACVRDVEAARARGESLTLGQAMLRRGILTRQEILRVLRNQNKTVLQCEHCGRRTNVIGYQAGQPHVCPYDNGRL